MSAAGGATAALLPARAEAQARTVTEAAPSEPSLPPAGGVGKAGGWKKTAGIAHTHGDGAVLFDIRIGGLRSAQSHEKSDHIEAMARFQRLLLKLGDGTATAQDNIEVRGPA